MKWNDIKNWENLSERELLQEVTVPCKFCQGLGQTTFDDGMYYYIDDCFKCDATGQRSISKKALLKEKWNEMIEEIRNNR